MQPALLSTTSDPTDEPAFAFDGADAGLPVAATVGERRQLALLALGRRAMAAADALALARDAAALLAETLEAELSSVARLDSDPEALSVWLAPAGDRPAIEYTTSLGRGESLAGLALGLGRPIIIADLAAEQQKRDARLSREGVRSAIVCPLKLNDQAFGALGVYSPLPNRFTDNDLLFVETMAHLVAATIARDRSERSLAAERAFSGTLLEAVEALVIVLSPCGRLRSLNRAAQQISSFESAEVKNRALFSALIVPEEVPLMERVLERLRRGESPVAVEGSILTKHGDRRQIAWNYSLQRDRSGEVAAIVGTGIDISQQRAAQQSAAARQQELQQLSAEIEQLRQAAGDGPALRPFQQLQETPGSERRTKPRRSYPYVQSIAPMIGDQPPLRSAFQEVLCHDISAGGFSFLTHEPPQHPLFVVAFGAATALTYLTAEVMHCTPNSDDSTYIVGCRYTGRTEYCDSTSDR